MQERKKRKEFEIDVKYIHENDPLTLLKSSFSKNISTGGFCIRSYEKLSVNDVIIIRFYLEDMSNYSEAKAKIVWTEEVIPKSIYDSGIEFLDITEGLIDKIDTLVQDE